MLPLTLTILFMINAFLPSFFLNIKNDLTKISQFLYYIEFADFQFTVFFTKFTTTMYRKKLGRIFYAKSLRKLANTKKLYVLYFIYTL